jgi:hypothetical protein
MGLLAVNWVKVEEAIDVYDKYYLGWREKVERGKLLPSSQAGTGRLYCLSLRRRSREGNGRGRLPL